MSKDKGNQLALMIRQLHASLGSTQEQFATRSVAPSVRSNRWEGGKSKPSPLAMRQIEELRKDLDRSELKSSD